jgi:hypothetical protein
MSETPNKLFGLRDYPPPKSWPDAGNSARVFTQQMDDWFSEFTTLTGNNLFTADEKYKKSFFIKNVTGNPNNVLSLWSQNHLSATYNELKQTFIEFNTDTQHQSRLQEELSKTLKPDLTKSQYRDAVADYIDKFNKAVRELDESDKHNLILYFKQQLSTALRGAIEAQISVMSDTDKAKADLSTLQQLALLLAANSQSSWDDLRRRYTRRSGVRIHSVMTQSSASSNDEYQHHNNSQVSLNAMYQQRPLKRQRAVLSEKMRLVRQYCFKNNLCLHCKKPRHDWVNGRCNNQYARVDDELLEKFRLSQQHSQSSSTSQSLNMRGR